MIYRDKMTFPIKRIKSQVPPRLVFPDIIGSEENLGNNDSGYIYYLKVPMDIDITYFLLGAPYHFVEVASKSDMDRNSGAKYFITKTWLPQKIVCGIVTILRIIFQISYFREAFPKPGFAKNPVIYIQLMSGAAWCLAIFVLMKIYWKNQKQFLKILNFILESERSGTLSFPCSNLIRVKTWVTIVWIIVLVYGVIDSFLQFFPHPLKFTFSNWWRFMIGKGRNAFFLSNFKLHFESNEEAVMEETREFSGWDIFFGVLGTFANLQSGFLLKAGNPLLLMHVLILWGPVCNFSRSLSSTEHEPILEEFFMKIPQPEKWLEIQRQYKSLKCLAQLINENIGTVLTLFVVGSVMTWGTYMDQLLREIQTNPDWRRMGALFFYLGNDIIATSFSCDICRKMDAMKDWLSENGLRSGIADSELIILYNELNDNSVSIRASNVFPLNYSNAANLLGITVTYLLISAQF